MVDYGIDMWCDSDISPTLKDVTGARLMAQAMLRRISTAQGTLISDPLYGIDIRNALSDSMTQKDLLKLKAQLQAQWLKDERVISVDVDVRFSGSPASGKLTLTATGTGAEGPFRLVLSVDKVSVEILSSE